MVRRVRGRCEFQFTSCPSLAVFQILSVMAGLSRGRCAGTSGQTDSPARLRRLGEIAVVDVFSPVGQLLLGLRELRAQLHDRAEALLIEREVAAEAVRPGHVVE